jgi:hypothetical protein
VTNLGDDAVKVAALVAKAAFSSREFAEVARGSWADIIIELEDDPSGGPGVDSDIELRAD